MVLAAWNFSPALAIPGDAERDPDGGLPALDVAARLLGVNPATTGYPDLTAREAVVLARSAYWRLRSGVLPQTLVLSWMEPSVTGQVEALARLRP